MSTKTNRDKNKIGKSRFNFYGGWYSVAQFPIFKYKSLQKFKL